MTVWPERAPEPKINVPLLRKVLEHITAHPEEWNQGWWAVKTSVSLCGTACCVAGWAVSFSGHDFVWEKNSVMSSMQLEIEGKPDTTVPQLAREELGLTFAQGDALFYSGNTLDHLWQLANYFTGGEIEIPEGFK